jgi:hypothetical protein
MLKVDGQWQVDLEATYAGFPESFRKTPAFGTPSPPAPAPAAPQGSAEVAGQFLATAAKWGFFNPPDDASLKQALTPLVVALPLREATAGNAPWVDVMMIALSLQYLRGAQPLPAAPEGGLARVTFQTPPWSMVMVRGNGGWKMDIRATYLALPDSLRKYTEAEQRWEGAKARAGGGYR